MTKKEPEITPPEHLSAATRAWWTEVIATFELETHHKKILLAACECLDRVDAARVLIQRDGLVTSDRFGQQRANPACKIEIDNKILFSRLLRELALDIDGPGDSRPPTIKPNANARNQKGR